jgi:hypothetical protein
MSHPSSTFLLMKANDPGLDEIWKDFYATLPKSATDRSQARKEREKLRLKLILALCSFSNPDFAAGLFVHTNPDIESRLLFT